MNRSSFLPLGLAAGIFATVALAACTTNVSASPPPPAAGSSCGTDSTVACTDGTGYSCTNSDAPEDSDHSLICSDGTPGNAGTLLYCCFAVSSDTTCGDDSTVSCAAGSFGFSCANASEEPNKAYPSLNCSAPVAGNAGSETYCCTD